ncbi:MAG: threonine synthase, partial [Oscillospiraceae bacterium]|nr:threonine synthase [Oscillospiraceae bacterium]
TFVIVFYPKDGTSPVQERQMTTQEGGNVGVCAVEGNFDDAQSGVKRLFSDPAFRAETARRGYALSAANSINVGRLVPQIAYYVHAYAEMVRRAEVKPGSPVNFCVPTGNFGNILAGLYAWKMGLPVGRLICASNRNRILTDVLTTGRYSLDRDFYLTPSPSMDILISSNFERAIHLMGGNDPSLTLGLMENLRENKSFLLPDHVMSNFRQHFSAYSCDDEETLSEIYKSHRATGKLFDPHTAVAQKCLRDYQRDTGDDTPSVVLATADPFKFPETMLRALGKDAAPGADSLRALSEASGHPVSERLEAVMRRPVRFEGSVRPEAMAETALSFLM